MMNTCRSEANQLELFVFLTICGSKSNNNFTLMHVTRITQIKIWLITQKWPNIIPYSAEWYSILALRLNTLTSNNHFFASPTIQLRLQRFAIRLYDESQSGAPLRQNMKKSSTWCRKSPPYFHMRDQMRAAPRKDRSPLLMYISSNSVPAKTRYLQIPTKNLVATLTHLKSKLYLKKKHV